MSTSLEGPIGVDDAVEESPVGRRSSGISVRMAAVILIPILNAMADVTTNFVESGLASPGGVRAVLMAVMVMLLFPRRAAVPLFLVPVYALLAYLFARSLATSDVVAVFEASFSKVLISFLMLPIGYHVVRTRRALNQLHWGLYAGGLIIAAQFALAQVFGWGESVYVEDSFYVGGALVQTTYTLALLALIWPTVALTAESTMMRRLSIIGVVTFIVFVLLVFRRASIVGLFVGLGVYWVLASGKIKAFARGIGVLVLVVAASPLFVSTLSERATARSLENRPLEEEARLAELVIVGNDFARNGSRHALFGAELFNSPTYFNVERQLHVDYLILLHGGGVVGLLLYGLAHLSLLWKLHATQRGALEPRWRAESRAVFWAVIVFSAVVSLSGSLNAIGYRSALFLYLGALLGVSDAQSRSAGRAAREPMEAIG